MTQLHLNEIEAPFDALNALIHPVKPAMNARKAFLNMRRAHLKILNVIDEPIDALFDASKPALNLVQQRDDDVCHFAHTKSLAVRHSFCNRNFS